VRDANALESALDRPRQSAIYENASISRQAATLFWGVIKNHPFLDGNKRTALVITDLFLRANGFTFAATEDEQFALAIEVAEHNESVDLVEHWFDLHLEPYHLEE
jgi:death-on-curing protein